MTATEIAAIASAMIPAEQRTAVVRPEVVAAFAMVESGGREQAVRTEPNGFQSWGLFQFGLERWRECGGSGAEWGKADATRQIEVMIRALRLYGIWGPRPRCGVVDPLAIACAWHNGWGTKKQRAAYYAKIKAALEKIEKEKR